MSQGARLLSVGLGLAVGLLAQAGAGAGASPGAYLVGPGSHGAYLAGAPLLPGTAILTGETVTTSATGVVVLTPTQGAGGVVELTGNASATVGGNGAPLDLAAGDALVWGAVAVATPQGAVFTPRRGSSYVVNVADQQAKLGVLTGAVATFAPQQPPAPLVTAGSAVQFDAVGGSWQRRSLRLAQLSRPDPNAALPLTIPASQSQ